MVKAADARKETRLEVLLLLLMGIVILLMVANLGLFLRMNRLQSEVLVALVASQARELKGLEIGTQAPNFNLVDTEGRTISLVDLAGQRVLLVFSSTRCSVCKEMYPHLRAFDQSRQDVRMLMISLGSSEENRQLVEDQDFGFPVLAWEEAVAEKYQVPGTPFFYLVDEQGVIAGADFANTVEQLEQIACSSDNDCKH